MSPWASTRLLATESDQRLLELARAGHERAFEAVVERYRRPLLRYCARMGLSPSRAEDAIQHALLQAWLALARGDHVRTLRPWLYRIAHNAAVDALRSSPAQHEPLLGAVHAEAAPGAVGESTLEGAITLRETLAEVAALPQMQREAILLAAVGGRSHIEVASELGISDGAVRGLLYRARASLRSAAAALTPQPLISWACRHAESSAPSAAEGLIGLSAPAAGTAGIGALALKGAAVAATAALLAAGAGVTALKARSSHLSGATPSARAIEAPSAGALGPTAAKPASAASLPTSAGAAARAGARHGSRTFEAGGGDRRGRRVDDAARGLRREQLLAPDRGSPFERRGQSTDGSDALRTDTPAISAPLGDAPSAPQTSGDALVAGGSDGSTREPSSSSGSSDGSTDSAPASTLSSGGSSDQPEAAPTA
ncbi:MAG: hypothetical protein QOI03_981 [Solirubrobacteraceae bacterium]|jgi:RNA polymerase sigma factor (sigma-70 family)|nr:hypothetical protein [Solirubrobacteraceae bacterium]